MKKIIFTALLLVLANSQHAFAKEWDKARDLTVDQELSEMKQASVILPPGKHEGGTLQPKTGQISGVSPSDAGATAKASSTVVNLGTPPVDSNLEAGTNPSDNTSGDVITDANTETGGETTPVVEEEPPLVGVDVSGGDDYLISADASVGDTTVSADVIPSDTFDDTILGATADIGAEIDATGDLSGSEADIGVEADVDGSVADDSITSEPADGLSSTPVL